ncbi:hypothetical protein P4S72_24440 [Vibrio sp. PP-XX7]
MVLELLVLSGRSLPSRVDDDDSRSTAGKNHQMDAKRRAFINTMPISWNPGMAPLRFRFTDGVMVGATPDRNGLRPSRYTVTKDDYLIMASESGVVDIDRRTLNIVDACNLVVSLLQI